MNVYVLVRMCQFPVPYAFVVQTYNVSDEVELV